MMNLVRLVVLVAAVLAGGIARAQEPTLAAARELYVAAEYSSALTMLTALANGTPSKADRQAIDLHRVLCLMALNRATEANQVIEEMLTIDPFYKPDTSDLPPRMRSVFADARKRLLPGIVQQKYLVARAAFEQKEYATAAEGFQLVLNGLSDPDLASASSQPTLADLKVLASGFHDLAAKAVPASEPSPAPAAVDEPPLATPAEPRIYGPENFNVVPPQAVRQVVPSFPGRVVTGGAATIDIVINEEGDVDSVSIVTSLSPQYDRMALNAAKTWKYHPATLNGQPVKYRKRLQLSVVPDEKRR